MCSLFESICIYFALNQFPLFLDSSVQNMFETMHGLIKRYAGLSASLDYFIGIWFQMVEFIKRFLNHIMKSWSLVVTCTDGSFQECTSDVDGYPDGRCLPHGKPTQLFDSPSPKICVDDQAPAWAWHPSLLPALAAVWKNPCLDSTYDGCSQ